MSGRSLGAWLQEGCHTTQYLPIQVDGVRDGIADYANDRLCDYRVGNASNSALEFVSDATGSTSQIAILIWFTHGAIPVGPGGQPLGGQRPRHTERARHPGGQRRLPCRHHDPAHMPAHIASSLVGPSVTIPVRAGKLVLGTWQRIILIELDGPKTRKLVITTG